MFKWFDGVIFQAEGGEKRADLVKQSWTSGPSTVHLCFLTLPLESLGEGIVFWCLLADLFLVSLWLAANRNCNQICGARGFIRFPWPLPLSLHSILLQRYFRFASTVLKNFCPHSLAAREGEPLGERRQFQFSLTIAGKSKLKYSLVVTQSQLRQQVLPPWKHPWCSGDQDSYSVWGAPLCSETWQFLS